MNNRLLIIASDFPPLAGTNTQRIQSFVRHLTKFGWEAIVVTRALEDLTLIDSGQLQRLGTNVRVHRVADPDVFARLRRRRGIRQLDLHGADERGGEASLSPQADAPLARRDSPWHIGLRWLSEAVMSFCRYFLYLPDDLAPWARACTKPACDICQAQSVHIVLASAPSYSCLVAGLAVARANRLPFVADFRDLWVGRPYRKVFSRWHAWCDRRLERRVVVGASRIVVASPAWIEHFRKTHGKAIADKCVVITNGYDESLIPAGATSAAAAHDVTTFLNTGAMYGSESPEPFLEGLGIVLQRRPGLRDRVRVRLVGYAGDDGEKKLRDQIDRLDLNQYVELIGPKPHDTCLMEQSKADVLLLFSCSEHRDTIRGKSFEYMSTGKPILALIHPQGIQAELLRKAGTAHIVEYGDVEATARAIEGLLQGRMDAHHAPDWTYIRSFEHTSLTQRLAGTLDTLIIN